MNDDNLKTIDQIQQFLKGSEGMEFTGASIAERYNWMEGVLVEFRYLILRKPEKGVIRRYIIKMTGYSCSQVSRVIADYKQTGRLRKTSCRRHHFPLRYTRTDIELLARTDELHLYLSGPATKKIMEREYEVYGHTEFERISQISVSHLYNGYIRIDTVHQGYRDGHKGVYHINAVDEVTQWEIAASPALAKAGGVGRISEACLVPGLDIMLAQFPFVIRCFHSDNGSEFINKVVSRLLNKLLIHFTKSRPGHTNDNGLVETKNGAVVRKQLGHAYIPQACAELLNGYHKNFLNPYVNFHRPCFFPVPVIDHKGKIKKIYPYEEVMTPYEKLKSLPQAESYGKKFRKCCGETSKPTSLPETTPSHCKHS